MKKSVPKSLDKADKGPKTELDQKFLDAVDKAKKISGIKSDRALSLELGRYSDFINRVRNGFQSAPAEAWDTLLSKFPGVSTGSEEQRAIYQISNTGNASGVNHGTMSQQIGYVTPKGGEGPGMENMVLIPKELHDAYLLEIKLLKEQVADKERTIQILLKQQS